MTTKHIDVLKVIGWIATLAGTIAQVSHWDPGTAALVMGLAHSLGSYVATKMPQP